MHSENSIQTKFLTYKEYTGSVEYSKKDNCFFGKLRIEKGSVTYEGQTLEELEQDFKNSVDEYMDYCATLRK